jgi:hypothetical protein
VFVTFHFVCLTWVFFRCDSIDQAFGLLQGLGRLIGNAANITWPIAGLTLAGIALQWLPENVFPRLQARFIALPAPAQCALLAGTAVAVARVSGSSVSQFIYFNF